MRLEIMRTQLLSKAQIQEAAVQEANELLTAGQDDPVNLLLYSKRVVEFLSVFVKNIESNVREEVAKSGGPITQEGATLSLGSTGDRLDFEKDSVYADLKKKLKAREDLLKLAAKSEDDIYDGDACLVIQVPLKTAGRETLVVKF